MPASVICLFNGKGGVGKTTSAVNIGATLASKRHGRRVLLVDMDVQSNCTSMMLEDTDAVDFSVLRLLMEGGSVHDCVLRSKYDNIDILPMSNKGVREESIYINSFTDREQTLRRHFRDIKDDYDFIIIDCPPALNEFTKNALVATDFVLMPFRADAFAYEGLARLLETVYGYKSLYALDIRILGVFMTHFQNTRVNTQTKDLLDDDLGDMLLNAAIRSSKLVSESTYEKTPLVLYKAWSEVSFDYYRLTAEILERMVSYGL